MDTLSHACLGALLARAVQPALPAAATRWWLLAGALAAAFPDLDYAAFWFDPYRFHTSWHRGPTHSLLLLPLWAGLLALLLHHRVRSVSRRAWFGLTALALASHSATDVLTIYGTQLLYPWRTTRFSLGTSFVLDAYFSLIVGLGLMLALYRRYWAWAGLAVLGAYLLWQAELREQALDLAAREQARRLWPGAKVNAYPQPLSPYHWLLTLGDDQHSLQQRVRLRAEPDWLAQLPWWRALAAQFPAPEQARWQTVVRFQGSALAQTLWLHPALAAFRRFAYEPRLYRIDTDPDRQCVWFSDAAFELPGQLPPFRYGLCRDADTDKWRLYRLRMFSRHEIQAMPE